MGTTPVDLFHSGNATSARLDQIRTAGSSADVDTITDAAGGVWVIANGKGASTSDAADPDWRGRPWKLAKGHSYSALLLVWNDDPGHWVWQPTHDTILTDYVDALGRSNLHFVRL
jgi:hypothetical protein